jgi:hypothetical protein
MDRYRIVLTRDGQKFGILDREQYDYCALQDENGTPQPLEWQTRAGAEAWLHQCFRTWNEWEGNGAGTPPQGWRRRPPEPSPFDRGYQFYN